MKAKAFGSGCLLQKLTDRNSTYAQLVSKLSNKLMHSDD